jgi:hypothetical protein
MAGFHLDQVIELEPAADVGAEAIPEVIVFQSASTSQTTLAGALISTLMEVTRLAALVILDVASVDGLGGDLQLLAQRLNGLEQSLVSSLCNPPAAIALEIAVFIDGTAVHMRFLRG